MSKAFLTTRITSLLVGAILITIVTVLGALFWMANEHNKKAAADSQTMIAGGVAAMQETLETVTKDYSWWQEAYDNIRGGDLDWMYSNMGSGVTEADTADIMVIVQPDLSIRYAWQDGMEEEPDPSILDRAIVDQMVALLADVPPFDVEARIGLFDLGDNIAMLAAARVVPDDLENLSVADLPINIMGYFLTPERIAEIGEGFLIDDLKISRSHAEGEQFLQLTGLAGQHLAHLHWTPQQPGKTLLTRAALPIGIALAIFAILGFVAAGRAHNAAKKLADSEEQASHAARSDSLTGLPNRLSFTERLASRAIQRAAESNELAVIFADVNGFKIVNDTVGHAGGDRLIQELSDRLRAALPKHAFLARVGGDEFNILVTHRNAADAAQEVATGLLKAFEEVFVVNGASFHVSAAAGYATSDDDDVAAEEVVRRADVAMYRAKDESAITPMAYDPARRTDRVLSADSRCRQPRHDRCGSFAALEFRRAWTGVAGDLHPGRRGSRPDRRHRKIRPGAGLRRYRLLAGADGQRQCLAGAIARSDVRGKRHRHRRTGRYQSQAHRDRTDRRHRRQPSRAGAPEAGAVEGSRLYHRAR
jgi:diguanylate cyclase (GGDEF)-like protein